MTFLWWLLLALCGAIVIVLFAGLILMARGGELNQKYSQQLMRWRVALQTMAIIVFAAQMTVALW